MFWRQLRQSRNWESRKQKLISAFCFVNFTFYLWDQLWKIDQLTDGSYRIASKVNKLALTATIKVKPGSGIALQTFTGDDAQRWVVTAP
jgi:hypothetical protein